MKKILLTLLFCMNISSAWTKDANDCDRLASAIEDPNNPVGVKGLYYSEMDAQKAITACQKVLSEIQNEPRYQYLLGRSYDAHGENTVAAEWFFKAAEGGYVFAQYDLGVAYDEGVGVEQSDDKAFYWYKKAAEAGDDDAQFNLALMYENGTGVSQSYTRALEWYLKSAEQGDADAQYNLSLMYEEGKGVKKSKQTAKYWLEKSKQPR